MGMISLLIRQFIYTSLILLPCLLCVNSTDSPSPPTPSPDFNLTFGDLKLAVVYPIIQRFRNTITADPFKITKTWVGPDICNKYKGFFCDTPPDNSSAKALVAIDINGFQLAAPTLDGFIDQLPDLAIFHANTNNFSGTNSPKISNLPYFYELDISNNWIFGVFPQASLGNSLTGCLPWEIGLLKNATVFYVSFNLQYHNHFSACSNRTAQTVSKPVLWRGSWSCLQVT